MHPSMPAKVKRGTSKRTRKVASAQSSGRASSASAASNASQKATMALIKSEMDGNQVWSFTRSFIKHFNTPPEVDYKKILKELNAELLEMSGEAIYLPIIKTHDGIEISWPNSKKERDYYTPLAKLLGVVHQAVYKQYPQHTRRDVEIFKFDRVMADGISSSSPLKPDGLAALKETQTIYWKDVDFAFEVKNRDNELALQAASYGRALLTARPGRRQSIVVTLNQEKNIVRFNVYNRVCFSSSPDLHIGQVGGFRSFVRIATSIFCTLSIDEDPSMDSYSIGIPGFLLQVNQTIARRVCVVGRATHVVAATITKVLESSEDITIISNTSSITDTKRHEATNLASDLESPTSSSSSIASKPSLESIPEDIASNSSLVCLY